MREMCQLSKHEIFSGGAVRIVSGSRRLLGYVWGQSALALLPWEGTFVAMFSENKFSTATITLPLFAEWKWRHGPQRGLERRGRGRRGRTRRCKKGTVLIVILPSLGLMRQCFWCSRTFWELISKRKTLVTFNTLNSNESFRISDPNIAFQNP